MSELYRVDRVWSAETRRYEYRVIYVPTRQWVFWSTVKSACNKQAKELNRAAQTASEAKP